MASISIREMTKRFGQLEVLHSISAEINDGEFLVVVGPSGCGKSTILRLIAGLEEITSGEVWIGEQLVNSLEPKDRNIAMVFQNYALYPHMNVFNNMAYGLRTRRFSTDEYPAAGGRCGPNSGTGEPSGPQTPPAFRRTTTAGCNGPLHCAGAQCFFV
jgi:ABC-type sugar transport system ATPase subunit